MRNVHDSTSLYTRYVRGHSGIDVFDVSEIVIQCEIKVTQLGRKVMPGIWWKQFVNSQSMGVKGE